MGEHVNGIVERWTVDYGDGSSLEPVVIPHAWNQDVSVTFEGPVTYRSTIEVPKTPSKLIFTGVSYAAEVQIEGITVVRHFGIWDAFEVPLEAYCGQAIEITVKVTKNGGATFPVREVASGFLPFVYHTFGGIHGQVLLVDSSTGIVRPHTQTSRAKVEGTRILVDGKPFYVRGLLHWGWYPELGHTNPSEDVIRTEVQKAKDLGFNLVKFCLWVPSHMYLEVLRQEGMEAWIELPLWDPSPDEAKQSAMAEEFERIVRQYRHHENVILWTVGCELSTSTSPQFRQSLTQLVKNLTGSPLVKDNSGGAEMYGGNLAEFGDFYDFHPYCDTQFYPGILDLLLPGPRTSQPVLLGEFNDTDVHRDLPRLAKDLPYWCSTLSELNDQGVRWQYDLPELLSVNRFAQHPGLEGHLALAQSSRSKSLFIRKYVHEAVRSRDPISGYVITGWRDTPVSSSGFFDDWDTPRFTSEECKPWNGPGCIFMIPSRRPPWLHGGNRPGNIDPLNQFVGQVFWKVGVHSDTPLDGGLNWEVSSSSANVVARGSMEFRHVPALHSMQIGEIDWICPMAGKYTLKVEFAGIENQWTVWTSDPWSSTDKSSWATKDPMDVLGFEGDGQTQVLSTRFDDIRPGLFMLTAEGTLAKPFWREAAYEFRSAAFWSQVGFVDEWERWMAISPDRVLSRDWLDSLNVNYEVLMNRIDVRTYQEDPILVQIGDCFVTTIRAFGGLGNQTLGIPKNAAGLDFVRSMSRIISAS